MESGAAMTEIAGRFFLGSTQTRSSGVPWAVATTGVVYWAFVFYAPPYQRDCWLCLN